MGRLEVPHSNCLRRIVGVKPTDRHRPENIHEQCGTSSLELMVRRWTLQWMGHVLQMDEDPSRLHCATRQPGRAVDPGPGLVNGALCNDCDLAEEDTGIIASGKDSVKNRE
eukprot:361070-Chlamydomonas_euryale.AAC.8